MARGVLPGRSVSSGTYSNKRGFGWRTVLIENHFRELGDELRHGIERGLTDAGQQVRALASSGNYPEGYPTRIAQTIKVYPPIELRRSRRSFSGISLSAGRIGGRVGTTTVRQHQAIEVSVGSPDFRSIFFEKGTRARRRGKLSRRTRFQLSREEGGVAATRALAKALRIVKPAIPALVARRVRW